MGKAWFLIRSVIREQTARDLKNKKLDTTYKWGTYLALSQNDSEANTFYKQLVYFGRWLKFGENLRKFCRNIQWKTVFFFFITLLTANHGLAGKKVVHFFPDSKGGPFTSREKSNFFPGRSTFFPANYFFPAKWKMINLK